MKKDQRKELRSLLDVLTPILNKCVFSHPLDKKDKDNLEQTIKELTTACSEDDDSKIRGWAARFAKMGEYDSDTKDKHSLLAAEGLRLFAALDDKLSPHESTKQKKPAHSMPSRGAKAYSKTNIVEGTVPGVSDSSLSTLKNHKGDLPLPTSSPVCLKGCGPKTTQKLAENGLETLGDLAMLTPSDYDDRRFTSSINTLKTGHRATVKGTVEKVSWAGPPWQKRMQVLIADETGKIRLVWFRVVRGYGSRFEPGTQITASGHVSSYKGGLQIAHPEIDPGDHPPSIVARYPNIEGISQRALRSFCKSAAELVSHLLDDGIPDRILSGMALPRLSDGVRFLHNVPAQISKEEVELLQQGHHPAQKRLFFGDLFMMQLELAHARFRWRSLDAPECSSSKTDYSELERTFGFNLTGAQKRCIDEIKTDISSGRPMQRLLQGDVGSGKTAVAFSAALEVLESGHQAAIMAPTEILAQQHAETFKVWGNNKNIPVKLLTGSTPSQVKASTKSLIGSGEPFILVGTHALLSNTVIYGSLGLVIIDEQHRFGVGQRRMLREKGQIAGKVPHFLVMTATPIPRSLALTLFGDLDLSVIDEMPPGRRPASTTLYEYKDRKEGLQHLKKLLSQDLSAYVVCPLVAESDKLGVADAQRTAERLSSIFPKHPVGLIHGRLNAEEKTQVLNRFRRGEIKILVATTVIEVGLDVPSAAVMMVINAERFGLAQLHQLRGRIGRSATTPAHCILMSGKNVEGDSLRRLEILTKTTDGFRVAEEDLKNRGPGELSGSRQSGLSFWSNAARYGIDIKLLAQAREAASRLIEEDPNLRNPDCIRLRQLVAERENSFFGAESG